MFVVAGQAKVFAGAWQARHMWNAVSIKVYMLKFPTRLVGNVGPFLIKHWIKIDRRESFFCGFCYSCNNIQKASSPDSSSSPPLQPLLSSVLHS